MAVQVQNQRVNRSPGLGRLFPSADGGVTSLHFPSSIPHIFNFVKFEVVISHGGLFERQNLRAGDSRRVRTLEVNVGGLCCPFDPSAGACDAALATLGNGPCLEGGAWSWVRDMKSASSTSLSRLDRHVGGSVYSGRGLLPPVVNPSMCGLESPLTGSPIRAVCSVLRNQGRTPL
jgi:hypothetical protein